MEKSILKEPSTIYLIAFFDPRGLSTISEQISSWCVHSRYSVRIINLHKTYAKYGMRLPDVQVVSDAAAIIIHPTSCYSASNLRELCGSLVEVRAQRDFPLILYKQDEHVLSHVTSAIIGEFEIDIILTCTSEDERAKVYPDKLVGNAVFEQVYTGYISDKLLANAPGKSWNNRAVDFFYRGSKQPPEIGELGFRKYSLARDLSAACKQLNLHCDASAEWEDRILGFDWLLALGNTKATVSLESGSNCFDFDGNLKTKVDKFLKVNASLDPWSDDGFKVLYDYILHKHEGNVCYGQIAPRHLEATATRTIQLLLPGTYSGFFEAGRHYIELDSDFSNFNEAVESLNDDAFVHQMQECAYEEIALNPSLHYSFFIKQIDTLIEKHPKFLPEKKLNSKQIVSTKLSASKSLDVVLMCPHQAHLDPRINWWAKHTSSDWDVHIVEIGDHVKKRGGVLHDSGDVLLSARDARISLHDLPDDLIFKGDVSSVVGLLFSVREMLFRIKSSNDLKLSHSDDHIWLLDYFLRVSVGLIESGLRVRGCDLLIVADLPALLAGVLLREMYGVPLIYDAQEIWSHSNLNFESHEIEWWNQLEKGLLGSVDYPVTVSSGIGQWYQHEMGTEMLIVPNFSPCADTIRDLKEDTNDGPVRFLFLGNFAENRGLEQLIEAWDFDPSFATLTLQGPHSEHRVKCEKMNKSFNRGTRGVLFADPVSETDLIREASNYHIGIIPYTYAYPYSHCSPNKLSQYMAAGCAIFSHQLPFVEQCVAEANCGASANFNSPKKINKAIEVIAKNKGQIRVWRKNALLGVKLFNWEKVSAQIVSRVSEMHLKDSGDSSISFTVCPPCGVTLATGLSIKNGIKSCNAGSYSQIAQFVESQLQKDSLLYKIARYGHRVIRKLFRK